MSQTPFAARTHEEMKDVLMNPEAQGPDVHYYMIRGGVDKTNVTVWESGTVGGEYIKTYGHYHVDDLDESYTILEGSGVLLLQMRALDDSGKLIDDRITWFQALNVKQGDTIAIPHKSGHLLVNTGESWLVTSDDSPFNPGNEAAGAPRHADYEAVKKMKGFAYYVVKADDGRPALVKNPLYAEVPMAEILDFKP